VYELKRLDLDYFVTEDADVPTGAVASTFPEATVSEPTA
jgi:hypothetical protein